MGAGFGPESLSRLNFVSSLPEENRMHIPSMLFQNGEAIRMLDPLSRIRIVRSRDWANVPDFVLGWLERSSNGQLAFRDALAVDQTDDALANRLVDVTRLIRCAALACFWVGTNDLMTARTIRRLLAAHLVSEAVLKAQELCQQGLFGSGLSLLRELCPGILGVGESSFFLFLICQNSDAVVKPLPFGPHIIQFLDSLPWSCPPVVRSSRSFPISSDKLPADFSYDTYLLLLHNWAHLLDCEPAQIELWLRQQADAAAGSPVRPWVEGVSGQY